MRVLLIGGGGREHAMALSILKEGPELFSISPNKNPGIFRISKRNLIGNENDTQVALNYALKVRPDIVFIGPEGPLASGTTDILTAHGFKVFAPSSKAAKLETSKTFLRNLMNEKGIAGNIESFSFIDYRGASEFIDKIDYEFVIKPDGLTGGKGVMVQGFHFKNKEEGKNILRRYFEQGINKILIERKESGEEFSLQAFVNGNNIEFLPTVQDYKRAGEHDEGPNTGGMGAICFSTRQLPFVPEGYIKSAGDILRKIVIAMSDDGNDYVGPIYGQFMATREGPKVIEINSRMGDPEAINVLSLMNQSLLEVGVLMMDGKGIKLDFRPRINVLRYIVPIGYGDNPRPSKLAIDEIGLLKKGLKLFYASVNSRGRSIMQTRSRSLGLLSEGISIEEAVQNFRDMEDMIEGEYYMRRDIGDPSVIAKKNEYMATLLKK
ncbi:MAG: phosphoribosylamine--glycine ligase [Thermoplasmata archaeon]